MTYVMARGHPLFLEREQPSFRSVRRVGVRSLVLSMPKKSATRLFPRAFFSLVPSPANATNNIYTGRSRPDRLLLPESGRKEGCEIKWDVTRPRRTRFYDTHLNEGILVK